MAGHDLEAGSLGSSVTQTHNRDSPSPEQDENALKSTKSKGSIYPSKPPHYRLVFSHALVTPEVLNHVYEGSGTEKDPYLVEFIENDPRNPLTFSLFKKWALTFIVSIATLAVAFVSSAYSGAVEQIIREFGASEEVVTLGISLFVLGFSLGPVIWAPLSELFGRQVLYIGTYGALTAFNAGAAGSQNMATLLVLRFLAGAFGSSPLTNAGGVIADMFPGRERGVAMAIFAAAPFMGPVFGPIVGGFVGESVGWRWVEGVMAIFTGVLWIIGALVLPETYAPVILSKRARNLSKRTGKVYKSRLEVGPHARNTDPKQAIRIALSRPWILLFKEPIVLLLTIYMAILYGTLYLLFGAFPIVYQQTRGWSEGIGGLAFLGVAVGFMIGVLYILYDNKRYEKTEDRYISEGEVSAPPESRLPPCIIGSIWVPIGMFWFAWTNGPTVPWPASVVAGVPFGFGMLLVFVSIMNYLIDAYTVYAASVLAANSVLRSLFGAAFPLFTSQMYANLGIHWASSIPAFLALMCVPFPFLFYKYGASIRRHCPFAKEAMEILQELRHSEGDNDEKKMGPEPEQGGAEKQKDMGSAAEDEDLKRLDAENKKEYEFVDAPESPLSDIEHGMSPGPSKVPAKQLERVKSQQSTKSLRSATSGKSGQGLSGYRSPGAASLHTRPSGEHLVLQRARSYASNW